MAESKPGSIRLDVTPVLNWTSLHGQLVDALFNEAKHFVAEVLSTKCPVCSK